MRTAAGTGTGIRRAARLIWSRVESKSGGYVLRTEAACQEWGVPWFKREVERCAASKVGRWTVGTKTAPASVGVALSKRSNSN